MQIFVHRDGRQLGPYSVEEVRARLANGTFEMSDNAWTEGMPEWDHLSSFAAFRDAPGTTPPPLPSRPTAAPATATCHHAFGPGISREELGPYARSTIDTNETPLHRTVIHSVVMVGGFIAAGVLALGFWPFAAFAFHDGHPFLGLTFAVMPIALALPGYIAVKTSELLITDRRVIIKVGLLQRRTLEMFISKIESVRVGQGVFGRMWDYGDVAIRGTGGSAELFKNIAAPIEFRNAIQRVQTASQR